MLQGFSLLVQLSCIFALLPWVCMENRILQDAAQLATIICFGIVIGALDHPVTKKKKRVRARLLRKAVIEPICN